MAAGRIQDFFGDDLDEAIGSLMSAPGAFGNILVGAMRQLRPIDAVAFSLVVAGWLWIIVGFGIVGDHRAVFVLLALLPSVLWLAAGAIGGLIFEIGGFGPRSLAYWESYLLILLFAAFGAISLRLAFNPRDRRVYRAPPAAHDA